jgi:hypothetical protein
VSTTPEKPEGAINWGARGPQHPKQRARCTELVADTDQLAVRQPTGTWSRELPAREGPPPPGEQTRGGR